MLSTVFFFFYINQSLQNQITILYYVCSFLAQNDSILLTLMYKQLFLIIVLIDENVYMFTCINDKIQFKMLLYIVSCHETYL